MKRIFSLFFILFSAISISANMQGHFFKNVENQSVQVAEVESKFALWLDLPSNTTFSLFRDETDALGIRHLSYQQSVNGVEILHGIVLVHAKNNLVFAVNGDIMDATIAAQQLPRRISPIKAAQKVRKSAKSSDASLKIVRAYLNDETVYRYAYEVLSEDYSDLKYIDAETGDIIKVIPKRYNADVIGTASTMYYGTQAITCHESAGTYYLFEEGRGIYTLDATNNTYKINYNNTNISEELMNAIDACSVITNTSASWSSTWNFKLKSVKIDVVVPVDSWYTLADGQADIYIKIKDANNNVLYTSGHKDDPTLPTTFSINTDIYYNSLPVAVELWDYDPIGGDDYIDGFIVDTYGGNMFEKGWTAVSGLAQGSYTSATVGLQPHLDAHWGMEKTLDFYSQKLNRNSYDNNGAIVYQVVNMPKDDIALAAFPLNAFAIKTDPYPMVYGTGLLSKNSDLADACVLPLVSIDIMAHEFTHLVTEKNGNGGLVYIGESGALNESFSDIIGIAVKEYATGSNDWLIGSNIVINASNMRSMMDPNNSYDGRVGLLSSPQPKTFNDNRYWVNPLDTARDNGGVHTNSGVQNYWFYLLSEGGTGTNDIGNIYSVTGIGIDRAVQIAYRNLIYYLTPEATHEDARNGSIQAAIDLYGQDSQEHQSVMNAWHAVGVGSRYDAPSEDFELKPGKYVIVANRDKNGDKNWYYMTSDLGTASTKRFQAVSTGTESMDAIDITDLEDKYVWTLEADGSNWKLKNGTQYVTWTSGNSANLGATAKTLTFDVADNQMLAHFNDGSAERYLSLNATTNNNYFAFYSGTNQIEQLFFLPYDDGTTPVDPPVESDRYVVLAQRNATSNWFYMTSDLGTASNKRYQAVDAGTSILADIVNQNLDDKYYWEIDGNKLKTTAGYSTWTSGNSANLDATGKDLTIQQQTDGTYTFSFIEGDNTRYLALNKTVGNDYFAYYNGTNQIYKLTLVKEGYSGTTTSIEGVSPEEVKATKILRDGQIYILRGDKTYTLQGQEME